MEKLSHLQHPNSHLQPALQLYAFSSHTGPNTREWELRYSGSATGTQTLLQNDEDVRGDSVKSLATWGQGVGVMLPLHAGVKPDLPSAHRSL